MTMTKKDSATCEELLRAIEDDYPAQIFVAFDGDGQASVILLFDKSPRCTFLQGHFSKATAAFEAFAQVEEKLRALDDFYAEKTDCPLWTLTAKK